MSFLFGILVGLALRGDKRQHRGGGGCRQAKPKRIGSPPPTPQPKHDSMESKKTKEEKLE